MGLQSEASMPTLLGHHGRSPARDLKQPPSHSCAGQQQQQVAFLPASLEEVSADFVEHALRASGALRRPGGSWAVQAVDVQPTTVQGLLSTTGRVGVTYSGGDGGIPPPSSVIVKLQAQDANMRGIATRTGNYEMEKMIYERLADGMVVGTPVCYMIVSHATSDNVVFVMEDLILRNGVYAIDQWRPSGCTDSEALFVAHALGRMHAQFWSWSDPLADWLPVTAGIELRNPAGLVHECAGRYRESVYYSALSASVQSAVDALLPRAEALVTALSSGPCTLLHHDARADNLFWGDVTGFAPGGVLFIDWQMAGQGVGPLDLAWFASGSYLEPGSADRMVKNRHLVEVYWHALTEDGVDPTRYTLEAAWRDYLLGIACSFLVITQFVKFGQPNQVLRDWAARSAHAMAELEAHTMPFERLV